MLEEERELRIALAVKGNLFLEERGGMEVVDEGASMVSGYEVTFSRGQAKTIQLVGIGVGKFGGRAWVSEMFGVGEEVGHGKGEEDGKVAGV